MLNQIQKLFTNRLLERKRLNFLENLFIFANQNQKHASINFCKTIQEYRIPQNIPALTKIHVSFKIKFFVFILEDEESNIPK